MIETNWSLPLWKLFFPSRVSKQAITFGRFTGRAGMHDLSVYPWQGADRLLTFCPVCGVRIDIFFYADRVTDCAGIEINPEVQSFCESCLNLSKDALIFHSFNFGFVTRDRHVGVLWSVPPEWIAKEPIPKGLEQFKAASAGATKNNPNWFEFDGDVFSKSSAEALLAWLQRWDDSEVVCFHNHTVHRYNGYTNGTGPVVFAYNGEFYCIVPVEVYG